MITIKNIEKDWLNAFEAGTTATLHPTAQQYGRDSIDHSAEYARVRMSTMQGIKDDRTPQQRLWDLYVVLTADKNYSAAIRVIDAIKEKHGFTGLDTMYKKGYTTTGEVYQLWRNFNGSLNALYEHLGLPK